MTAPFRPTLDLAPLGDNALHDAVQAALDAKTKPRGALGRLEALALQLALILCDEQPRLRQPQLVVFAADHGIAAQGVSAYPAEVTRQMVLNFLAGGAAVSVLARQHGLAVTVADCGVRGVRGGVRGGVAATFDPHPQLARLKVAGGEHGTADASLGPALLMARLTGEALALCAGRGTGLDDAGLAHKVAVLQRALAANAEAASPLQALAALGGLEIATMAGAVQQAGADGRVIVVDGFITTAAVAVAAALQPDLLQRCVFAHCSHESGHARWLQRLGVSPLLDLQLRLGEGSGAALAWPLLESACRVLSQMASFESAGVSRSAR